MAVRTFLHYALEVPDQTVGQRFYEDFGLVDGTGRSDAVRLRPERLGRAKQSRRAPRIRVAVVRVTRASDTIESQAGGAVWHDALMPARFSSERFVGRVRPKGRAVFPEYDETTTSVLGPANAGRTGERLTSTGMPSRSRNACFNTSPATAEPPIPQHTTEVRPARSGRPDVARPFAYASATWRGKPATAPSMSDGSPARTAPALSRSITASPQPACPPHRSA